MQALIWQRRAYRRRWAIDRARAALGVGLGGVPRPPTPHPPPRARYTPRIRSASVHVPCCVAHQKLPKKAAPSPPRVRRAQRPGESLPRCSRGPGGAHGCTKAPVTVENARTPPFHAATPSRRPRGEGSQRKKGGFPPHGQTASAHWSCEFEERSAAAGGLRCRNPPHTSLARAAFRGCAVTPPETPVCPSRLS